VVRTVGGMDRVTEIRRTDYSGEAGQSGDTQGLSGLDVAESQSVRELVEEGQPFEAEVVDAVENAPPPESGPLSPREVPEDDVPDEYRNYPESDSE
jgi:hypothetical protein